jgi:hypothetical protein
MARFIAAGFNLTGGSIGLGKVLVVENYGPARR